MPVLTLYTLDTHSSERVQCLADALVQRLSPRLNVPPELLWVHVTPLAHLQEGLHGTVDTPHLVVTVMANPRPDETVRQAMSDIAETLVEHLKLELHQVWIHWMDLPPARTFANGQVY